MSRQRKGRVVKTGREHWVDSIRRGGGFRNQPHVPSGQVSSRSMTYSEQLREEEQQQQFPQHHQQQQQSFLQSLMTDASNPLAITESRPTSRKNPNVLLQAYGLSTSRKKRQPKGRERIDKEFEGKDRVLALKKSNQEKDAEINLLKGRLNVLKKQMSLKDKDLEDVLDEALRAQERGQPRPVASHVHLVSSLKNKLFEAEAEASTLQAQLDSAQSRLKFTKIEEIELEVTIYYNEVLRLRTLLKERKNGTYESDEDDDVAERDFQVNHDLKDSIHLLQEENGELKLALAQAKQQIEKITTELGGVSDKVDEFGSMSRVKLLQEVRALIKELHEKESAMIALHENVKLISQEKLETGKELKKAKKAIMKMEGDIVGLNAHVSTLESSNTKLTKEIGRMARTTAQDVLQPVVDQQRETMKTYMETIQSLQPLIETQTSELSRKLDKLNSNDEESRKLQEHHASLLLSLPKDPYVYDEHNTKKKKKTKTKKKMKKKGDNEEDGVLSSSSSSSISPISSGNEVDEDDVKEHQVNKENVKMSLEEKNKSITILQSLVRGHSARKRIMSQLKERKWQTATAKQHNKERAKEHLAAPVTKPVSSLTITQSPPRIKRGVEGRVLAATEEKGDKSKETQPTKVFVRKGNGPAKEVNLKDNLKSDRPSPKSPKKDNVDDLELSLNTTTYSDVFEEDDDDDNDDDDEDDASSGMSSSFLSSEHNNTPAKNRMVDFNDEEGVAAPKRPPTRERPARPRRHVNRGGVASYSSPKSQVQEQFRRQSKERMNHGTNHFDSEFGMSDDEDDDDGDNNKSDASTTDDEISGQDHPGLALHIEDEF
eukprot:m.69362 g.69362  ORF g.69362 m.69362 type:complete len:829 (-) comp8273_c0_seq3:151-2637(-)